jgi:transposase
MSERELRRAALLAQLAGGAGTLVQAAKRMELSYRQAKRLWKRYRKHGAAGLVHRSAGGSGHRAKPAKLRTQVLGLIREKYWGEVGERFGPTLAAAHLASEDRIELSASTVRRWMLGEGLWSRERKARAQRMRRKRKEHFGELVQMDGSFHEWLEGRGPRGCLMNLVDDATGTTLCRMGEQETIWAAVGILTAWMEKYGVPQALYTDWKNVYVREPTAPERWDGKPGLTQFGRMCAELGIRIIAAGSPQAKGRVERNHGTHQDRLVKKLRRKNIAPHAAVNRYLEQAYCDQHNQRFAIEPRSEVDYHLPGPGARRRREIFRLETERVLGNDGVVRHHNRFYQWSGGAGSMRRPRARWWRANGKTGPWRSTTADRSCSGMRLRSGPGSRNRPLPSAGKGPRLTPLPCRITRGEEAIQICIRDRRGTRTAWFPGPPPALRPKRSA